MSVRFPEQETNLIPTIKLFYYLSNFSFQKLITHISHFVEYNSLLTKFDLLYSFRVNIITPSTMKSAKLFTRCL